jgi:hypothetical protein
VACSRQASLARPPPSEVGRSQGGAGLDVISRASPQGVEQATHLQSSSHRQPLPPNEMRALALHDGARSGCVR